MMKFTLLSIECCVDPDPGAGSPIPIEFFELSAVLGGKKPYKGIQAEVKVAVSSWNLPRELRENWHDLKDRIEEWMANYQGG